jgi:undecaprenyl-diphosphatase
LCFLTPVLWWNFHHDWVTLQHTSSHFAAEQVTGIKRATRFAEFAGGQFGVVSPLTCWLVLSVGLAGLASFGKCDRRERFLLLFSIVPLFGAMFLALKQRVEPNWPAPVYVAGVVLVVGKIVGWPGGGYTLKHSMKSLHVALAIGLLTTSITYVAGFGAGIEGTRLDPAIRLRGWRQLGNEVGAVYEQLPSAPESTLLVAFDRAYASELAFYMPQHPEVVLWNPSGQVHSQYDVWGRSALLNDGRNALVASPQPDLPAGLVAHFDRVTMLQEVTVPVGGDRQLALWLWWGTHSNGEPSVATRPRRGRLVN